MAVDNVPFRRRRVGEALARNAGVRSRLKPLSQWSIPVLGLCLLLACAQPSHADGDREIITVEEIEIQKPATLMELLNRRVGMGNGGNQLSLRGVPGVAVYVDGFARGSSAAEIDKIKPQDVMRIEILRGAASARYGAEALGGAVVVTTRQSVKSWEVDAVQGYNSFDSRYSRVIGSGSLDDVGIRLSFEDSLSNRTSVMDRANNPFVSQIHVQDAYLTKREGDFKANYRHDWLKTAANLTYLEQTRNYGRPNSYNEYTTLRSKWLTEADFGELKLSANLLYEENGTDVFRDAGGTEAAGLSLYLQGPERTDTFRIELQASYGDLNLGVIHSNDWETIDQNLVADGRKLFGLKDSVEQLGIFASYGLNFFDDWRFDLSGRYDRYRYYDVAVYSSDRLSHEPESMLDTFNPKLGLSWKALSWLSLRASAATGFIPPSPATRYYRREQPTYIVVANPGLKPEQSETVDFGIQASWQDTKAGLTLFYTRWTDKVERLTTSGIPAIQTLNNLGQSVSRGAEFSFSRQLNDDLSVSLNYTLNLTEITEAVDAAVVGNRLAFQPMHRLNAVLEYRGFWDSTTRLNLHYESEQYMDYRNIDRDQQGFSWLNNDYVAVDLLVSRKFKLKSSSVDLTFGINNLFDNSYAKNFFQVDPGREVRGEIGIHF
jgi:outer membrane receptor protein involved in Fe transport